LKNPDSISRRNEESMPERLHHVLELLRPTSDTSLDIAGEGVKVRLFRDDAFTGLEAAIVLIAFVVVASVFAYTILGVGFTTTQKSQEVVQSGVTGASSTLQLFGEVYGISEGAGDINMVNFSVGLTPGGSTIDFNKVVITFSSQTNLETLSPIPGLQSTSTTPGTWAITSISGESGATNNLLERGEQFTLSAHPVNGAPKDAIINVEVKSGVGTAISIRRTIPAAVNTVNILY
jgi:archaeal flagellin FlaB